MPLRRAWMWSGIALVGVLAIALATWTSNRVPNEVEPRGIQQGLPIEPMGDESGSMRPGERDITWLNQQIRNGAARVDGVRDAWAVAHGPEDRRTVVVGIILDSSLNEGETRAKEFEVANTVRQLPGISRISVTSDPADVQEIRSMYQTIEEGEPTDQFVRQIEDLRKRMPVHE